MNGGDLADQRRALRSTNRRARKWWHSLWWWGIDSALYNAFVIWAALDESRAKRSFTDFCEAVAAQILGVGPMCRPRPTRRSATPSMPTSPHRPGSGRDSVTSQ
jgi:hypothetical protein